MQKKTVFDLSRKYLNDTEFVRSFLMADGISALTNLINKVSGGTLAYALAALETAMSYGYGWESIGADVVSKIVECILDSTNIQVKSSSLKICAHMIGNKQAAGFWVVHHELVTAAKARKHKPYEAIISAMKNEDVNIKVGALHVINSFIEHAPDRATFEEFLLLIENFGYLEELKAQLTTVTAVDFKKAVYWHQVAKSNYWAQEKAIGYDKTNPEHEAMLMELWTTCFPNEQLENRVSEQWKLLGFQGTDPGTDFRGMGILGLKHILYFAKKYTRIFTEMAMTQAQRKSHYYPVSTAGINISAMLLEILNVGKKQDDEVGEIFPILFDHPHALEEMYCVIFQMFHRVWDEMKADYMDFTVVAGAVKETTVNALKGSHDIQTFRELIRVPDPHGPNQRADRRVSRLLDLSAVQKEINTGSHSQPSFSSGSSSSHHFSAPSTPQGPGGDSWNKRTSFHPSANNNLQGSQPVNFLSRASVPASRSAAPAVRHTAPPDVSKFNNETVSDTVMLDIFVALANQSKLLPVSRETSIKNVIEMVSKAMKKKMKKCKKGEIQQLFVPSSGVWLDDSRKVWSYLLKDNERLELKTKPSSLNLRRVTIEINLESTTFNQPVDFLPETSVRGIIQTIDKPKAIVQQIQLFGLYIEGSASSHIWLEENRTLSSYGLGSSKLVFTMRSASSGAATKQKSILLQIQVDNMTKTMQFDEVSYFGDLCFGIRLIISHLTLSSFSPSQNNTASDVVTRVCTRLNLNPANFCLFFPDKNKYLADELPIAAYAVTPSQVLIVKQKDASFRPDRPVVEMLGVDLSGITFRDSTPAALPPPVRPTSAAPPLPRRTESTTNVIAVAAAAAANANANANSVPSSSSGASGSGGGGAFSSWTVPQVIEWLQSIGMEEHAGAFQEHNVDGAQLSALTTVSLKNMGIQALGIRKEILRQIRALN